MGKEHHLVEAPEAWDPELGVPALEAVGQGWESPGVSSPSPLSP